MSGRIHGVAVASALAVAVLITSLFGQFGIAGVASAGAPRLGIIINGNGGFTSANGIVGGSGSASDPYVIEGWNLNDSFDNEIDISYTTANFVIRNIACAGIRLSHVSGANIQNCMIYNRSYNPGISIYGSNNVSVSRCTASDRLYSVGISVLDSNDIAVLNCELTRCIGGITLQNVQRFVVSGNNVSSSSSLAEIMDCHDGVLSYNHADNCLEGIQLASSNTVTVSGNVLSNSSLAALSIEGCNECTIESNEFGYSMMGMVLSGSNECIVQNNTFNDSNIFLTGGVESHFGSHTITSDNLVDGKAIMYYANRDYWFTVSSGDLGELVLVNCTQGVVSGARISNGTIGLDMAYVRGFEFDRCEIAGCTVGIYAYGSTGNRIANSSVLSTSFSMAGAYLIGCQYIDFENNSFSAPGPGPLGVTLQGCNGCSFSLNSFVNSGLTMSGNLPDHFSSHHISSDNIVNGKPILYLSRLNNQVIDNVPVGQIIMSECSHGTLKNIMVAETDYGIQIYECQNTTVENVSLESNFFGLCAVGGVWLWMRNSSIIGNMLGVVGINVTAGWLWRNNFTDNAIGLLLLECPYFMVSSNDFVNNIIQASSFCSPPPWIFSGWETEWSKGYPQGGNYWSDYSGSDEMRGRDQDIPGPDGFGDTPYSTVDVYDQYPRMMSRSENMPPIAFFSAYPYVAYGTDAVVNAVSSLDPEDPATKLEVRCDWESDGVWDTAWSTNKMIRHNYALPGTYNITVEVRDTAGLVDDATATVYVDADPPVTEAILLGTPGQMPGWYSSTVSVWLNATDNLTGVSGISYSLDGQGWLNYETPVLVGPGNHTFDFFSYDRAGISENVKSINFIVDLVCPVTSCDVSGEAGENGWFTSETVANLSVADDVWSNETHYMIDGGPWQDYDSPVNIADDGIHLLEFYSVDLSGRIEPAGNRTIMVDRTPPATTLLINGILPLSGWYSSAAIQLAASDATSGANATFYRIDAGDWTAVSGPISITEEGSHTVEFYSSDRAGNQETVNSTTVRIDASAPTKSLFSTYGAMTTTGQQNDWYSSAVLCSIGYEDSISGVASVSYRIDGGEWSLYSGSISVAGEGTHTVELSSADAAGNMAQAATETVKIDLTAPSLTVIGVEAGATLDSDQLDVSWSSSDQTSGLSTVTVVLDGRKVGGSTGSSLRLTGLAEGSHSLTVTAVDKAGNSVSKTIAFDVALSHEAAPESNNASPIAGMAILAALAVATLLALLRRRGKSGVDEEVDDALK